MMDEMMSQEDTSVTTAQDEGVADRPAEGAIGLAAFGKVFDLATGGNDFLAADSQWRMREVYEPYLAANPLPLEGVLVDVGAGFGGFSIPFASTFPGWTVWCFEADEDSAEILKLNVKAHGLENVIVVPVAVGPESAIGDEFTKAISDGDADSLALLANEAIFQRHRGKGGFIQMPLPDAPEGEFETIECRAVPSGLLAEIRPDAVKMTAPQAEQHVLAAMRDSSVKFVFGEMWAPPRTASVLVPDQPDRSVYLPVAGTPWVLRHRSDGEARAPALDVVVALYNNRDYVLPCVESIVGNLATDVRAIVVDDGSADGGGDLVEQHFSENPRVRVVRKPNGGCASARNYGRLNSEATHIAFVDADDLVEPEFFPELLELARYTGDEIVQGGFAFLEQQDGEARITPSYESDQFAERERLPFGSRAVFVAENFELMTGQPTIWRRVYRRDFLDNRKVWFPEHIRAFDDQIFQLLSLQYAGNVFCMDHVNYLYRQHPGQDIKQGDERFFYSLEMFRLVLKRALAEGWNNLAPVVRSYINTVKWIHAGLRRDLKPIFIQAAAELWVFMHKSLGKNAFSGFEENPFSDIIDFEFHAERVRSRLANLGDSFAFGYLDAAGMHVPMVRGMKK